MANLQQSQVSKELIEDSEEDQSQFVTFHVGTECMAFDMNRVMEIVRVPETVNVPMTPGSLIGLANLRGAILPVISLRRVLNMPDIEHNDATRVMVLNYAGQPMGFIVDRVTRVIGVPTESVESIDSVSATIDAQILSGVLKGVENEALIQLVDVDALTEQEYGRLKAVNQPLQGNGFSALQGKVGDTFEHEDEEQNILQLVSFKVAGQEYSFSIETTQEIIRLPSKINSVPKTQSHVLGMIDLRHKVLPLVNLRSMFNLPLEELSDSNRIIVLTLRKGKRTSTVGVVVDEVREVLRVHKDSIEAVPQLLLEKSEESDLEGICQLDGGKRIVTLLSAEQLFYRDDIMEVVENANNDVTDSQAVDEEGAVLVNGQDESEHDEDNEPQMVVFNLEKQEYGVMIESVREILRLPENLTKVPKTLDFVEGMINLRGNVLPIIDMRRRFNITQQEANDRQRILVLNDGASQTGFIVDCVSEVLRLQADQIETAPNLSADQIRLMGRVVNLKAEKRIITVLDPEKLLSSYEKIELEEQTDESISR